MKYCRRFWLTFIMLVCFSVSLDAQYESLFGNYQTSWNVKTSQLFGSVLDSTSYERDTIISLILHKRVGYYRNTARMATLYLYEDTIEGKAWYFVEGDTTKYAIYDMGLSVGDTWDKLPNVSNGTVDSIYYFNGRKYIRFDSEVGTGEDKVIFTFIEGVGTNVGIAYHEDAELGNLNPVLLCQNKDDTLSFVNDHEFYKGECRITNLNTNKESGIIGSKTTIFPNPTADKITIDINSASFESTRIQIYDTQGRLVFSQNYNENSITVDVSKFNSGIYFIVLKETNKTFKYKICINK